MPFLEPGSCFPGNSLTGSEQKYPQIRVIAGHELFDDLNTGYPGTNWDVEQPCRVKEADAVRGCQIRLFQDACEPGIPPGCHGKLGIDRHDMMQNAVRLIQPAGYHRQHSPEINIINRYIQDEVAVWRWHYQRASQATAG